MTQRAADFVVVGGGIVGLTIAGEMRRRFPDCSVVLLEKEQRLAVHASGRNSGVLHAGFYYTADSLKARFSRDGNRSWIEYCEHRGLAIRRCGKLVVARTEEEAGVFDVLMSRARANGVRLERITDREAREIEPSVRTHGGALFSPDTASVNARQVVESLAADVSKDGVDLRMGEQYLGRDEGVVRTTSGSIPCGYVINAAGLHADRIARDYGFARSVRILPFRGVYLVAERADFLRTHVYPVPELDYPFLGVHFTLAVDGRIKIGPTAMPALWREHYRGLTNFHLEELLDVLRLEIPLFLRNKFGFRRLAIREIGKYSRRRLVDQASGMLRLKLRPSHWHWGSPGIRAQLFDLDTRRLEMDFRFEGDDQSFHILNAVSPAFTCALPFSVYLADEIESRLGGSVPSPARALQVAPA